MLISLGSSPRKLHIQERAPTETVSQKQIRRNSSEKMGICLSLNTTVILGLLATSTGSEVIETGDLDATRSLHSTLALSSTRHRKLSGIERVNRKL